MPDPFRNSQETAIATGSPGKIRAEADHDRVGGRTTKTFEAGLGSVA